MLVNHVVIATDVKHIEVWVVYFPVAVPRTQCLRHRTGIVLFQNSLFQQFGSMNHTDILALDDFVTDAPADNTGMIPVALHHGMDILLITRVNQRRIVVRILLCAPAIEGLANHQHAQ